MKIEPSQPASRKLLVILALAILFFICSLFSSCGIHRHYVKVATDPQRSDRDKTLLLQVCNSISPSKAPEYIKGKDSLRVDTFTDKIIEYRHDTAFITTTNTVYKDHWRVDTVKTENTYLVALQQDQLRDKDKTIDKLTNQAEADKKEKGRLEDKIGLLKFRSWMGWISLAGVLALYLVIKFYFRKFL
jgi:hypothetical protein